VFLSGFEGLGFAAVAFVGEELLVGLAFEGDAHVPAVVFLFRLIDTADAVHWSWRWNRHRDVLSGLVMWYVGKARRIPGGSPLVVCHVRRRLLLPDERIGDVTTVADHQR